MRLTASTGPRTELEKRPLTRIAVLHHPKVEATQGVARAISDWLQARGLTTWLAYTWDEALVRPEMIDVDLIIVLGGDGSVLRAARMAAGYDIPLLGINMGRLGFLSELQPGNWQEGLPKVLAGDYWLENRMMLRTRGKRSGEPLAEQLALNDVVISRGALARMIRLRAEVDGDTLTTYSADGLIISTPTGSTAYALAAGGPVLPPELRNILIQPIAPHLTLNRAIVLAEGAQVRIVVGTDHEAILTVDGQMNTPLVNGDEILVEASEHISRFVRLGPRGYFYNALLARLGPQMEPNSDGR